VKYVISLYNMDHFSTFIQKFFSFDVLDKFVCFMPKEKFIYYIYIYIYIYLYIILLYQINLERRLHE